MSESRWTADVMSKVAESILPDIQAKERDHKLSDGEGLHLLMRPTGIKL